MGIVQRQGLRNTVISYFGLALGFVNTAFVLPTLLAPAQLGLTTLLVSIATVYAQFSAFGFASVGIRFFPYFRNREAGHHGFLPFLLGLPMLGFALITAFYLLAKPLILARYEPADVALLQPFYAWGSLLALFTLLYSLQDAYLKGLYHTAFSSFLQDIVLRVLIASLALLYGKGFLQFHEFVLGYIGLYGVISLLLTGYLAYIGELHLRPTRAALRVRPVSEIVRFGGFALLSSLSGSILGFIDSWMVSAQIGLAAAGIYGIAYNISTALTIPARSLNKIAFPLLAQYWKDQDLGKMADFYRDTTRLNTILGCYLALGISLNLDFIYSLIRNPVYATGTTAVLLLLAGRLYDGITGVNGLIVVTSPRYRFDLIFNLSLAGVTIVLNRLLIPVFGITGSALATLFAIVAINTARTWFVWYSYRLQPFTWRIPLIMVVAAGAGGLVWLLPALPSKLLTMLLRGTLLTALYGGALLGLGLVPEARPLLQKVLRRP
ncbi:polysaccharide biosynthesis C-terminal domain-containing protein [Hymenobacter sp. BT635]|uniref:Polysaccharide biosynthesis C-terminal domain-containing protein n=1 Tax=Hymenobacter nitidus TaxID=2880929 RepID=A0ABS8AHN4_9BACT|nr:polysaccharide biosynthesis C-terminal domain-containing protein [Hymenobacter nitidus]MCB2379182.1 polysaccharide biosynthesis C-terminal domain-containing protein [Hymenobacter nitidus]